MIARSSALIIGALFLTIFLTVTGFIVSPAGYLSPIASPALIGVTGGITGSISLERLYRACTVCLSYTPAPSYISQIEVPGVLITPSSGLSATIPVNWVLGCNGCWAHGTFKIGLNPGWYSVTLTSCLSQPNSLGCSQLPITALVASNSWTQVEIFVRTGIG